MKIIHPTDPAFVRLCQRGLIRRTRIERAVQRILEDVRLRGDEALVRYTRRFDHVRLTAKHLRVSELEISGAFQHVSPQLVAHLQLVIHNMEAFYRRTLPKPWKRMNSDGVLLGEQFTPLERVGIYIPAGTAPLISTVYMTVIPAKLAGVPRIVLVTPPTRQGTVDPHILAVANLLNVTEVYKVGGAQAIAALAFGTKTVPKVDKIVGPGNPYVVEAKRQVFGYVGIDLVAGPSEVAIIANRSADPQHVLADLRAEGEHANGLSVLITPFKGLAKLAAAQIPDGYCIVVNNVEEAVDVANQLAPEHLQINVNSPRRLLRRVRHAGAIFLGPYSPVAVGDYVAGPSHVLPTGGTARAFSGLGVEDFMKRTHVITYSRRALERARAPIAELTQLEGLPRHYESVAIRLDHCP